MTMMMALMWTIHRPPRIGLQRSAKDIRCFDAVDGREGDCLEEETDHLYLLCSLD